jgi:hypothetical protein
MIFGVTAFSQVPFSALPDTGKVYLGVTGLQLTTALNRVVVDTPFNINVTVALTGVPLVVNLGTLGATWIPVDTTSDSIWTPIIT